MSIKNKKSYSYVEARLLPLSVLFFLAVIGACSIPWKLSGAPSLPTPSTAMLPVNPTNQALLGPLNGGGYPITNVAAVAQAASLQKTNDLTDVSSIPPARKNLSVLASQIISESTNTTVTTSQDRALFNFTTGTNALTATLPSAATAGDGFATTFRKDDNSTGSVTVNGALLGIRGHALQVVREGTKWINRPLFLGIDSSSNLAMSALGTMNQNPPETLIYKGASLNAALRFLQEDASGNLGNFGPTTTAATNARLGYEYWIGVRGDSRTATGLTQFDPIDCSTQAKFATFISSLAAKTYVTIHLGPGTYVTSSLVMNAGWQLIGSGYDRTTIQLQANLNPMGTKALVVSGGTNKYDQVLQDLTLDGNILNQSSMLTGGVLTPTNANITMEGAAIGGIIRRVQVIGCGSPYSNGTSTSEAFWLSNQPNGTGHNYDSVIDSCICIAPNFASYDSFILMGGNLNPDDNETILSRNGLCAHNSVVAANDKVEHTTQLAYAGGGFDSLIFEDNYSYGVSSGFKDDTGSIENVDFHDNWFYKVIQGVRFSPISNQYHTENIIIHDNYFQLVPDYSTVNPQSCAVGTYKTNLNNLKIYNNTVCLVPGSVTAGANNGAFWIAGLDQNGSTNPETKNYTNIYDNIIDLPNIAEWITGIPSAEYGTNNADLEDTGVRYENNHDTAGDDVIGEVYSHYTYTLSAAGWYRMASNVSGTFNGRMTMSQDKGESGKATLTIPVVTGTLTSGSNIITSITSTTGFVVGQIVAGTGIPNNSTIASLTLTTLTLQKGQNAKLTGSEIITGQSVAIIADAGWSYDSNLRFARTGPGTGNIGGLYNLSDSDGVGFVIASSDPTDTSPISWNWTHASTAGCMYIFGQNSNGLGSMAQYGSSRNIQQLVTGVRTSPAGIDINVTVPTGSSGTTGITRVRVDLWPTFDLGHGTGFNYSGVSEASTVSNSTTLTINYSDGVGINMNGSFTLGSNGTLVTQDILGTGTLTAGTVNIANANVTSNSVITITPSVLNSSTALGSLSVPRKTAGTGFTVTSYTPGGISTQTGDLRSFNYEIKN